MKVSESKILMSSLFATGIAGIVSEYVLATLATYFLWEFCFSVDYNFVYNALLWGWEVD